MLMLRSDQLAALDRAVIAAFRRRVLAHLKATFPERTDLASDDAADAIDAGMARAAEFGHTSERDVVRFLDPPAPTTSAPGRPRRGLAGSLEPDRGPRPKEG